VYLETSVAQQAARVKHGRGRPLLADTDPALKLARLISERGPLYREIADVTVCTDFRKVRAVADEILRGLPLPPRALRPRAPWFR
jgi:shikimate kinase